MSDTVPPTGTYDTGTRVPVAVFASVEMTATTLPISVAEGVSWRTMCRVEAPVQPGDYLLCSGWTRVTDNAPSPRYNVGISSQLQFRDEDGTEYATWSNILSSTGENITVDGHHLEVGPLQHGWFVPADWTPGDRVVVALQAYAQSTAARAGDVVTADKLGEISVMVWR